MNKILIKEMGILSLILGLVCGVLVLVPFIDIFVILILLFLSSVIVYLYMKKKNALGLFEPKEAAMYGAVIGFVSFLGFCATMLPLTFALSFLFKKSWFSFVHQIFSLGMINGIVFLVMLVLFIAAMSAMFNAFSAMLAILAVQAFEGTNKNKDDLKIDVEIK